MLTEPFTEAFKTLKRPFYWGAVSMCLHKCLDNK